MMHGFRKGTALLLVCILTLVLACAAPAVSLADPAGSVGGTTAAAVTFDVTTSGSGSGYIKLGGTKGTANVTDYDFYGNNKGTKTEDAYGFFKVEVSKTGYSQSYIWAPSASMSTYSAETSQSLVVVFPVQGTYKVTVTPLAQQEINGVYWAKDRFQNWVQPASWTVSKAVNCQCGNASGGSGSVQPGNAQVTVYCYDTAGNYIRAYTETITASRTIYPQNISGYSNASTGQYITYYGGSACSPSTVTFKYQKAQSSGTVTVYCYDTNGSYIRSYTETVTSNRMIYPQSISGYSTPSGGQYVTCSNGVCNPSTVTFKYQKIPTSTSVTVNCYATNGAYIRSYTQTVTGSMMIYPQAISGYKTVSGGQYITYNNGICSPNTVTFQYEPYATSATVTVNCYDLAGIFLDSYTETVSFSKTVTPKAISGYNVASGGQYVTFSNGTCTPSTITFRYQKVANPATLNIDCYDANGNYIRSYTETLTSSRTVYPQAISGYTIASGGEAVTYSSDGTCSPSKISFSYQKIPTPASVTIRCIDNNGNVIRTYTETVTADRTIAPPAISGYTALSSAQQVTFSDGACSPAQIDFQYQSGSAVAPGSDPQVAYPSSWDTQFKPGTANNDHNNWNQVQYLPYLYDDNPATSFSWIWWSSESDLTVDSIPEMTAYFDSATVSSIGIRNGNLTGGSSSYRKYARAKRFFVKIYDTDGNMSEFTMNLPDQYSADYRRYQLGTTYTNVSRIEFWIAGYYNGDSSKHNIHISDIIFYK